MANRVLAEFLSHNTFSNPFKRLRETLAAGLLLLNQKECPPASFNGFFVHEALHCVVLNFP